MYFHNAWSKTVILLSFSVLPRVSKHLPNEVIVQSEQLAKLITQSERYSQFAYNRPLNVELRKELSAEVTRISHTRYKRCQNLPCKLYNIEILLFLCHNMTYIPDLCYTDNYLLCFSPRDDKGSDDNDCIVLDEAPTRKRPRLDKNSKWKITEGILYSDLITNYFISSITSLFLV